jgi:hypothetical protein
MSLTTKTLKHVVLAYNLPRGAAVDRGKVAQAAQKTAQAEAPHAALAAQATAIRTAMRLLDEARRIAANVAGAIDTARTGSRVIVTIIRRVGTPRTNRQ